MISSSHRCQPGGHVSIATQVQTLFKSFAKDLEEASECPRLPFPVFGARQWLEHLDTPATVTRALLWLKLADSYDINALQVEHG